MDLEKVSDWKYAKIKDQDSTDQNETEGENSSTEVMETEIALDEESAAKTKELQNWADFDVYQVVPDEGQSFMSTRWVITREPLGEVKARLVARGFEETRSVPSDSPTVSKECLRVVLALTASGWSGWSLASFDIKAAFLPGKKLDRVVFLRPPTEARIEGFIWKLKKAVYGLEDASRY